ncbi:MAG: DUF2764 family protein [Bacteroidales bacterium]|nr:DUF2764 family protein [Bacteroidales bacterium]
MNNYEYIIASLPVPDKAEALDAAALVAEIRGQLSDSDNSLLDLLLAGFSPDSLDESFYVKALSSRNAFISKYFLWDLRVRNTKTEYLNRKLGRPEMQDVIDLPDAREFDSRGIVEAALSGADILQRERDLDALMWDECERLTELHVFDLDIILAFTAKLMITDRWNRLDPATGRELFRSLVDEIRKTR